MRRHEPACHLLVGVVLQREDDPVRTAARLLRLDRDSPHDAVGTGRGGDLDQVAVGAGALYEGQQVDCRAAAAHRHGIERMGRPRPAATRHRRSSRITRRKPVKRKELRTSTTRVTTAREPSGATVVSAPEARARRAATLWACWRPADASDASSQPIKASVCPPAAPAGSPSGAARTAGDPARRR